MQANETPRWKRRVNHLPGKKEKEKKKEFGLPTSFLRSARFASNVLFLAIFDLSHLFLHFSLTVSEQLGVVAAFGERTARHARLWVASFSPPRATWSIADRVTRPPAA